MTTRDSRLPALLCLLVLAAGCASHTSSSLLMGDSNQRIELTGFSFDTSEAGDAKVAAFAGHQAAFGPERIVVDGREVWSGPYRRAAASRGKAAQVLLTVDGNRVPADPAQPRM